jgi:PAS domain-containing protein
MSKPGENILTETILESNSDGDFTVDAGRRITSFNRAAEEITDISRVETIGRRCSEGCSPACARRDASST